MSVFNPKDPDDWGIVFLPFPFIIQHFKESILTGYPSEAIMVLAFFCGILTFIFDP